MGFPYDEAAWSVVDGAMFMGWGTAMPGFLGHTVLFFQWWS